VSERLDVRALGRVPAAPPRTGAPASAGVVGVQQVRIRSAGRPPCALPGRRARSPIRPSHWSRSASASAAPSRPWRRRGTPWMGSSTHRRPKAQPRTRCAAAVPEPSRNLLPRGGRSRSLKRVPSIGTGR